MAQIGKSPWSPSIAVRSATTCADPRATDGNGVQKSSKFEHLCVREALTSLESHRRLTFHAPDVQVYESDGSLAMRFSAVACSFEPVYSRFAPSDAPRALRRGREHFSWCVSYSDALATVILPYSPPARRLRRLDLVEHFSGLAAAGRPPEYCSRSRAAVGSGCDRTLAARDGRCSGLLANLVWTRAGAIHRLCDKHAVDRPKTPTQAVGLPVPSRCVRPPWRRRPLGGSSRSPTAL
jgi:hypothetical protein